MSHKQRCVTSKASWCQRCSDFLNVIDTDKKEKPLQQTDQPAQINMNIKPPAALDISHDNLSLYFQEWKRELNLYMRAIGLAKQDNKIRSAVVLYAAGSAVIKVYSSFYLWGK